MGVSISILVGCDFDSGLCDGWHQSTSDVFDWTRHDGSTATANTGPDNDHTSGSGKRNICLQFDNLGLCECRNCMTETDCRSSFMSHFLAYGDKSCTR